MTTNITELAQREKFEAWFVNDVVGADVTFPTFEDGEYSEGEIYDEQLYFTLQAMWMAWKAAGAELVEALEKAQQRNGELETYSKTAIEFREAARDENRHLKLELEIAEKRIAETESRTVKMPTTRLWAGVTECYEKSDVVAAIRAAGVEVSDD